MVLLPPPEPLDSPSAVSSYLQSTASASKPHYLILFASPDKESAVPWCPDCVAATSILDDALRDQDATLVFVGDKPTWKDPANAFRTELGVSKIPTVIKASREEASVEQLAKAPRLVEGDCIDTSKLASFIKA